jgi:hypothetical protein
MNTPSNDFVLNSAPVVNEGVGPQKISFFLLFLIGVLRCYSYVFKFLLSTCLIIGYYITTKMELNQCESQLNFCSTVNFTMNKVLLL